ncbi:hypothetical protein JHK85_023899 [Glycine max]|nr:hypothetical protein JHK85_023899 [Glycine max]
MASIPVACSTHPRLQASPLFQSHARSRSASFWRVQQRGSMGGGGAASSFACSTSQFRGGFGFRFHRRQGKFSLLSFGGDDDGSAVGGEARERDLPLPLTIGLIAQYVLKPVLGILVAKAFGLSRMFYAGFVLTACVSGAQLSSYANFLSKGDVALGILLTSYTTIASVIVTPLLTGLLIGSVVPVDAVAMSKSILQVVLVPVTLGLLLNTYAKSVVSVLQPVMPFVAMICTSLCIGSPLALNRSQILTGEGLRQEEQVSRTISLCTGMQSSTLAGLLATQFLDSSQAVPPACSVIAMAIMGIQSDWRIHDDRATEKLHSPSSARSILYRTSLPEVPCLSLYRSLPD